MNLNLRQINLIEEIIYSKDVNISEFARLHQVARQTIYEDISSINFWLKSNHFGTVIKKDGNISLLLDDHSELINALLLTKQAWNFANKQDRIVWIIYQLFFEDNITTDLLVTTLSVSKTTIINDMKDIRSKLKQYEIILKYVNGRYFFVGDEIAIRIGILNILSSYIRNFSSEYRVKVYREIWQQNIYIGECSRLSMDILELSLAIIVRRLQQKCIITYSIDLNYVESLQEKQIIEELLLSLDKIFQKQKLFINEFERQYLLFVLHSFIKFDATNDYQTLIEYFTSFTTLKFRQLISADISLNQLTILIKSHFLSFLFRMKLGIILYNPLVKEIKSKYAYIYYCAEYILKTLCANNDNSDIFIQSEAGYLCLLFITQIQIRKNQQLPRVVIACYEGISVSKILKQQLEAMNLEMDIVTATSIDNIATIPNIDYIITTTPIEFDDYPIIYVHPILESLDKKKLLNTFNLASDSIGMNINEIFAIIQKYVDIDTQKSIISDVFAQTQWWQTTSLENEHKEEKIMINDVLTEETIQFKKRCSSWDEALDLVAKPLLDNGNIKESYIVKIKGNLADFGEYIMLRDGFALPHARPEDGVEKMGMSFLKLEEPVFLSDNKKYPIYVIVMLAAIDSHKHLHALSNLVDCIAEDEDFAELLTINSASELYEFIERHTK